MAETKELAQMSRKELETELQKARQELEWLNEDRQAYLGQTGVHIGVGHLQRVRAQFEREEQSLKERIAQLEAHLGLK